MCSDEWLEGPDRTNPEQGSLGGAVLGAISPGPPQREEATNGLTRTPIKVASKPVRRRVESADQGVGIHRSQLILGRQEPVGEPTTWVCARFDPCTRSTCRRLHCCRVRTPGPNRSALRAGKVRTRIAAPIRSRRVVA